VTHRHVVRCRIWVTEAIAVAGVMRASGCSTTMTRFKELRGVEAAIEHTNESEVQWVLQYCETRQRLAKTHSSFGIDSKSESAPPLLLSGTQAVLKVRERDGTMSLWLYDVGTNPTLVNGEAARESKRLAPGDTIECEGNVIEIIVVSAVSRAS
jgi:hypothetical protein